MSNLALKYLDDLKNKHLGDKGTQRRLNYIENELKAFHILVHFLAEDLKEDIVNDTDTDWSKEYDESHEHYKELMSKEDFLLVIKVLKDIFKK